MNMERVGFISQKFSVFGPDGEFLLYLPVMSWDVAKVLAEVMSAFRCVVDIKGMVIELM